MEDGKCSDPAVQGQQPLQGRPVCERQRRELWYRRGVEVEVPPEVAEVLEHSQQQDERTAARIAAAEMSDT